MAPTSQFDIVRVQRGPAAAHPNGPNGDVHEPRNSSWLESVLGLLASFVLHGLALVMLALMWQAAPQVQQSAEIVLGESGSGEASLEEVAIADSGGQMNKAEVDQANPLHQTNQTDLSEPTEVALPNPVESTDDLTEPRWATNSPAIIPSIAPPAEPIPSASTDRPNLDANLTDALSGRHGSWKAKLLGEAGGNDESERAVELALRWLANHQELNGSWSLNFPAGPHCGNQCGDPGQKSPAKNAATALAILPFLGNGQTHREGPYAEVVQLGLEYLTNSIRVEAAGGSFMDEGQMYSHGLATIAICEALAMTNDKSLRPVAKQAVQFIVSAQNESRGGWRYRPGEMGDTTVTGWQLMALKTASMSYVTVPSETIRKAWGFIDSVELQPRYQYSYQEGGRYEQKQRRQRKSDRHKTTSAVGLLCRMYLGWERANPVLSDGVNWLHKIGPSVGRDADLYYNYYATQVVRHYGGDSWPAWNKQMRDFLVKTQSKRGHEAGSWFFPGEHNEAGGRLYCTALATLILEVYYRHLPLYKDRAVTDKFRL